MTTYRVILDTETRPNQAAAPLDHLPSVEVDAPDVDTAARLAVAHHIDNRPDPPPAGTSFGLVVITPMPTTSPTTPTTTSTATPNCTTSTSPTGRPTTPPTEPVG